MRKMTENEFKDKLDEYSERNKFWTEKTINQLGYSINLFTTIGIAFLGFLVVNRNKFPHLVMKCSSVFSMTLTLYLIATLLIFSSIGLGFISILCRLFDFRITRHLALTRKRFLSRNKEKVLNYDRKEGLIDSKIIDISNEKYCKIFKKYLRGKTEFINECDFIDSTVIVKFEKLRKESKILGDLTWKTHRYQILSFLTGILLYGFTILR